MRTFKCEGCGITFPTQPGWTEEMAREEFSRLYPGEPFDNIAKTCDECHAKIELWRRQNKGGQTLQ